MLDFTPTTSLAGGGEKLGGDPQIGQPTCCGLRRELFFSEAVTLSNIVDNSIKGCHVWELPTRSVRVTYVDWCEKYTCCVYHVSSACLVAIIK
jgi:hypothetical protein